MKNPVKTSDLPPTASRPSQDEIALRAHQLWCQQGCPHGHDVDNWLEAQHQLFSEYENQTNRAGMPPREDVPLHRPDTPYGALAEDAPLATRVDKQLRDSARPASRRNATSLDL